jgi:hypothetical protein
MAVAVDFETTVRPAFGGDGYSHAHDYTNRDRRQIREAYRQGFGRDLTLEYGRPAGWILFLAALEKVSFPVVLLLMAALQWWEPFWVTIAAETAVCLIALAAVTKGRRIRSVLKGIAVTPIRYALVGWDLITMLRFSSDLWITNNRKWRK